mmetsp:Transcript_110901/g.277612  ORF Transcript_110901/g.277612 Transcript_110901/m.277612 type:complete len:125 (-) Transcript_110901:171-545(-)
MEHHGLMGTSGARARKEAFSDERLRGCLGAVPGVLRDRASGRPYAMRPYFLSRLRPALPPGEVSDVPQACRGHDRGSVHGLRWLVGHREWFFLRSFPDPSATGNQKSWLVPEIDGACSTFGAAA